MGSWHDIRLKFPLPWKNKITILRNDLEYNLTLKFNSNAPIIGHPLGGGGGEPGQGRGLCKGFSLISQFPCDTMMGPQNKQSQEIAPSRGA